MTVYVSVNEKFHIKYKLLYCSICSAEACVRVFISLWRTSTQNMDNVLCVLVMLWSECVEARNKMWRLHFENVYMRCRLQHQGI